MSTTFLTIPPFSDVSRLKDEAKRRAKKDRIPHHEALDRVAKEHVPGTTWDKLQPHLATLDSNMFGSPVVFARLQDGPRVEFRLDWFEDDLSDFVSSSAIGGIEISSSTEGDYDDNDGFRIVVTVEQAEGLMPPGDAYKPLGSLFDPEQDQGPLRLRLGPAIGYLLRHLNGCITRGQSARPEDVDGERDVDSYDMALEAEDLISEAEEAEGFRAAVWAARASLAQDVFSPRAYVYLSLDASEPAFSERMTATGLRVAAEIYGEQGEHVRVFDESTIMAIETVVSLHALRAEQLSASDPERSRYHLDLARTIFRKDWMSQGGLFDPDRTGLHLPDRIARIVRAQ